MMIVEEPEVVAVAGRKGGVPGGMDGGVENGVLHGILTQVCGNDFMVLKVAPPVIVKEEQLERFMNAIKTVVDGIHCSTDFWRDALRLAQRAINI